MRAPVVLDFDLDFWAWPRREVAVPYRRAYPIGQMMANPQPAVVARRLSERGYGPLPAPYVCCDHVGALEPWAGMQGATVVHFDAHHDLWPVERAMEFGLPDCSNYLRYAAAVGRVAEIVWVVPAPMWLECAIMDLCALGLHAPEPGPGFVRTEVDGVPLTVTDLAGLPAAAGPASGTVLALSPDWVDWPLFATLAPAAMKALGGGMRRSAYRAALGWPICGRSEHEHALRELEAHRGEITHEELTAGGWIG